MQSFLYLKHHLQDVLQGFVADAKQSQQHVDFLYCDASFLVAVVDGDADGYDDGQQDQRDFEERMIVVIPALVFAFP